jgi:hypothetical protein
MDAKQVELLKTIADDGGSGFVMVNKNTNALKALVAAALVETNPAQVKGMNIAARLTDQGRNALTNTGGAQHTEGTTPAMTPTTNITPISGFEPPAKAARTPRAKNNFGGMFDAAPVGGSFFVPAADGVKHPNRAVKLAARAYARSGVQRFNVYVVEAGKQYGSFTAPANGAVVTRAPDAQGPAEAKPRKKKGEATA